MSDDYKTLRSAIGATQVVAALLELIGILSGLGGLVVLILFGLGNQSILGAVVGGAVFVIGLLLLFGAWRLHIGAEMIALQISMADNSRRTAEAVELLASTVRKK